MLIAILQVVQALVVIMAALPVQTIFYFVSHLGLFISCAFQIFSLAWDWEFQTKLDYAWYTSVYQFFP